METRRDQREQHKPCAPRTLPKSRPANHHTNDRRLQRNQAATHTHRHRHQHHQREAIHHNMDYLCHPHPQTVVRRPSDMAHYQFSYPMYRPEQLPSPNVEQSPMPAQYGLAPWQAPDMALMANTNMYLGGDDISSHVFAQRYQGRAPSVSHSVGARGIDATAAPPCQIPLDNAVQAGSPWSSAADPATPVGGEPMNGYMPSPMGTFSSAASNISFPLTPDAVNPVTGFEWSNPDIMASPGVAYVEQTPWSMPSSFDKGSTAEAMAIRPSLPNLAAPLSLKNVTGAINANNFVSSPSHSQHEHSAEVATPGSDGRMQTPAPDQPEPEKAEPKKHGRKKTPESARKVCGQENTDPVPASGRALRTAARKVVRPKSAQKPGESAEERRARVNHNQVEKQYRNRLHEYFDNLLKVLPDSPGAESKVESENDEGSQPPSSSSGRKSRNWSKAEVLERACRHICELQDTNAKLMEEIKTKRRESIVSLSHAS